MNYYEALENALGAGTPVHYHPNGYKLAWKWTPRQANKRLERAGWRRCKGRSGSYTNGKYCIEFYGVNATA